MAALQVSDLLADLGGEFDGGVVPEGSLFDLVRAPVGLGAGVLLAGSAAPALPISATRFLTAEARNAR